MTAKRMWFGGKWHTVQQTGPQIYIDCNCIEVYKRNPELQDEARKLVRESNG